MYSCEQKIAGCSSLFCIGRFFNKNIENKEKKGQNKSHIIVHVH